MANKIRGIRCVEATEPVTARLAREHNDANMMSMGARIVGTQLALGCVDAFLAGEFQGGRHVARVDKIRALERDPDGRTLSLPWRRACEPGPRGTPSSSPGRRWGRA